MQCVNAILCRYSHQQIKQRNKQEIYNLQYKPAIQSHPPYSYTLNYDLNWSSVTPLPIAAVLLIPPETIFNMLST